VLAETMEDGFFPTIGAGRQPEHRAIDPAATAALGRAVQVAIGVDDQTIEGVVSVVTLAETVQNIFDPGSGGTRSQAENCTAVIGTTAAGCTIDASRTIQDHAAIDASAIPAVAERV
jgi:hypothetical protein